MRLRTARFSETSLEVLLEDAVEVLPVVRVLEVSVLRSVWV